MKRVRLNDWCMGTKERAHRHIQKRLRFPDYYGGNLDALYDCLAEIGVPTEITLVNAKYLRTKLGDYAKKLITVVLAASAENPRVKLAVKDGL